MKKEEVDSGAMPAMRNCRGRQLLNPGGSTLQLAGSGCSSGGSGLARRPSLQGHPNKGRKRQSEGQRQLVAQGMGQTIRLLTLEASFMLLRHGPTTSKNTGAPAMSTQLILLGLE